MVFSGHGKDGELWWSGCFYNGGSTVVEICNTGSMVVVVGFATVDLWGVMMCDDEFVMVVVY
ncbi:hypothetical protein L484_024412 [Morus notabilis]|uniref:Uncharacterized protein n=1 Tax=Morus notabilis TaxID=981085 RepID=W9S7T2_9ROSA|nr:hypothetical protein L484_024412 [Morus notabilis]